MKPRVWTCYLSAGLVAFAINTVLADDGTPAAIFTLVINAAMVVALPVGMRRFRPEHKWAGKPEPAEAFAARFDPPGTAPA